MRLNYYLGLLILLLYSCGESNSDSTKAVSTPNHAIFQKISSSQSNITFVNTAEGNEQIGMFNYDYFYNGGGVATGDLNNDGLVDIVFSGNSNPNQIYLNKGGLKFEDISVSSGIQSDKWSTGLTLIDINSDGWLDIYVCNSGPFPTGVNTENQLYINNKDNTFTESAAKYKVNDMGRSTHASFFDMDNDGDLDLFVLNHSLRNRGNSVVDWFNATDALSDKIKQRESCAIYENIGDTYKNVSKSSGVSQVGFGLGHVIRDFNEDGLLDIYVSNDFFIPDFLYINQGNGKFKDEIKNHFGHTSFFAMGSDAGDINNDGLFDLITVDMTPGDHFRNKTMMASMNVENFNYLKDYRQFIHQYMFNSLFINAGNGQMKDIGLMCGVSQTDWSWAPLLCDFDNSGYKDLFISNGYSKDILNNDWKNELNKLQLELGEAFDQKSYNKHLEKADATPLANQFFANQGNLQFINQTDSNGLSEKSFSNGAAYADFDNDGDFDLVVNNFEKEAFLYQNNSIENTTSNYINVVLKDPSRKGGELNAQICISYVDQIQCNTYAFARGFQSYVQPISHFGLGDYSQVKTVEVIWLDGTSQVIRNPEVNTTLTISKSGKSRNPSGNKLQNPIFTEITTQIFDQPYTHQENQHNEYAKEILLPHSQSNEGPALTVADINNDGLEDFYIGGAAGKASKIYLQTKAGKFIPKVNPQFEIERTFEDVGATFADIDMDGTLDLYVASGGGSEFVGNETYLQDRLYKNDGNGLFTKVKIPAAQSSTKSVLTVDLNNDGLLEIISCGRTTPGKYPEAPSTTILSTTRQGIIDKTEAMLTNLSNVGMITDAVTEDINSDGLMDVILVGEWMPITILINTTDGLEDQTSKYQLQNTTGWWSHINAGDFDNDGDTDYIVGNIGSNNKFHPSPSKPLFLNANDFDDSGTIDIVLNKIYNGKRVPTRGKECSTEQMPFISKKFDSYEKFASASLDEIYSSEKLDNGINLSANSFESIILEKTADGFRVRQLPKIVQISPINGSVILDVNKDGNLDIVVGGNKFNTEVETQRYDAGSGCILLGDGEGGFTPLWKPMDTGLELDGDVRNLQVIHLGSEKTAAIIVANNNGPIEVYSLN